MMILRTGDLNPNRFDRGYSRMESLKQAMLQHELIFRNQVRELHRLYWTQKNLMNELHQKWFDARAPSSSSRVALIKWMGSTEEKNEFSESSCARENVASLEQFKCRPANVFSNHMINFSLHLPADESIKGTCVDLPYSHTVIEDSKSNDNVGCGFEEVIAEKDVPRSASSFSRKEVIELEAPVEPECHEEENEVFFGFRPPLQKGTGMLGSQPTAFSDQVSSSAVGSEMHHIPSMVHLDEWHDGRLQDQKSFSGLGNSCVAALADHSRTIQEDKPLLIDLNVPLENERSHDLNDPADNINLKFISSVEQDQSTLVEAITKAGCDNQTDCFSFHGQDSKPFSSPESKLNLNATKDKGDTEIMEGTKVISSSSSSCEVQLECCGKPVEGSTDSNDGAAFININAVSSSINSCKQGKRDSNITSSNSTNLHEFGSEEDTLSSHAITDDSVTTQLNSSQNDGSSMEKLKPVEEDLAVAEAAGILIFFSSERSDIPIDHQLSGVELIEFDCDNKNNQPLLSSDSFESMTLQLSEVQNEDHLSISEPLNLTETEKNGNGVSLRRGRGLRDFQKEILPGLASLARHEICEDLHNIGHKLRRTASRNARKNWFVPVQGRRSKLYRRRN